MPTPLPPDTISYATPRAAAPSAWTAGRILEAYVPTLVLLAAIHGIMLYLVPRFETVFSDSKVEISGATNALFAASQAYRGAGWMVVSAALFLLPVTWIAATGYRRRDQLYRAVVTLLAAGLVAWVVAGLFLPMISMIERLSSPTGK